MSVNALSGKEHGQPTRYANKLKGSGKLNELFAECIGWYSPEGVIHMFLNGQQTGVRVWATVN